MMSCSSKHIKITDEESGEILCQRCGVVLGMTPVLDVNYELRPEAKNHPDVKWRLGSYIGKNIKERDQISKNLRGQFAVEKTDKNLIKGKILIEKYIRMFTGQSAPITTAQKTFAEIRKYRRWEVEPCAVACILYAFREHNIPISVDELAEKTFEIANSHTKHKKSAQVWATYFTPLYREIYEELGKPLPLDRAVDKVGNIASKLNVSEKVRRSAVELLNRVTGSTGANPFGVAAGALYIASEHELTLRELAMASGMVEPSIRKSANWILKDLGLKPEDFRKYSGRWKKTNSGYRCP